MSQIDHAKLQDHIKESDTETREGEREYFEHVSAQSMSVGGRLVAFVAIALMIGVGASGYFGDSSSASAQNTPAAISDPHLRYDHHTECDEYTPYGGPEC